MKYSDTLNTESDMTGKTPRTNKLRRMNLLATPLFVASITMLALNDFVLKGLFHNWLTGKLSDFAGLIALTVFASALWPSRRWLSAAAISAGFVYWKSPYSQSLIDRANDILPFSFGRTPDYSDCVAIAGVWLVCLFISHLRPLPVRSWLLASIAVLSLFLFTATTYIPRHSITGTALFPPDSAPDAKHAMENQLQALFDSIAGQHGLRCVVCDSLANGRLYVRNMADHFEFSLAVNFDAERAVLFFDISCVGPAAKVSASEIALLRTEVESRLQALSPAVKTEKTKKPKGTTLLLGVWKKNSNTSYITPENWEDYKTAKRIVEGVATRFGLKMATFSRPRILYYSGRLFGPSPADHELVVGVDVADSPLVPIDVTSYSEQYSALQLRIVDELERELQAAFGEERASVR